MSKDNLAHERFIQQLVTMDDTVMNDVFQEYRFEFIQHPSIQLF